MTRIHHALRSAVATALLSTAAAGLGGCATDSQTRRGAGIGAATGAVVGGIIGHQSGETGAGAAIGAAAGGIAGGAVGKRQRERSADSGRAGTDSYGYTSSDYLGLLTSDEKETLRARAQGKSSPDLADYLTSQEKANLRARAAGSREIGR